MLDPEMLDIFFLISPDVRPFTAFEMSEIVDSGVKFITEHPRLAKIYFRLVYSGDSPNRKKIVKELSLSAKIQNKRIEKTPTSQQDIILSRALAPLIKLLTYARMHSNKNTTSLFLKGRNVNIEIDKAMKEYFFDFEKIESISSGEGCILQIKNIKTKNV